MRARRCVDSNPQERARSLAYTAEVSTCLAGRARANAATQAGRSRLLALVFNPRQSSCSSWLGRRYSQIGSHGEQKLTNLIL